MDEIFATEPLNEASAIEAYSLVRLLFPGIAPERWRAFVTDWLDAPLCRSGIVVVRNRATVVLAIYAWRVGAGLDVSRQLEVPHLFIAGLPGQFLAEFVVNHIENQAIRRNCGAIVLEQSADSDLASSPLPENLLAPRLVSRRGKSVVIHLPPIGI